MTDANAEGPQLGDILEGQQLVAVGLDFTFTEILASHEKLFKELDLWLTGIRTYELEDAFETDAGLWDELEDCGYAIGEGEVDGEQPGTTLKLYDVWVDADKAEATLQEVQELIADFQQQAIALLPVGLHGAASTHESPSDTLKLIAALRE
jgi:hypothetical protein